MSKKELLELISKKVYDLMMKNEQQFKDAQQIMTPVSTQIGVLATLEVLEELKIIELPKE